MLLTLTSACAPQGFGPVTQSQFLQIMGLEARLGQLLANVSSQEEAERLVGEAQRLVGPDEMGQIYKALAITAPRPSRIVGAGGTALTPRTIVPLGGFVLPDKKQAVGPGSGSGGDMGAAPGGEEVV